MDALRRFVDEIGSLLRPPPAASALMTPFTITFPTGKTATAVRVPPTADPNAVIAALGITACRPALAVTGGAALMEDESVDATRLTVDAALVAFAAENHLIMVDGGTHTGSMAMIGQARTAQGCDFALIGVAPASRVAYPGHENPGAEAQLDPDHTHFVLVEGENWGDESDLLAGVAAAAGRASGWQPPVLGVIINGGGIVAREAHARATGSIRFPLLVLEGSGRFADELATAVHAQQAPTPEIADILEQGEVYVQPIAGDPELLRRWLRAFFRF